MDAYKPAEFEADDFNWPFCGIRTSKHWQTLRIRTNAGALVSSPVSMSTCFLCQENTIWREQQMIYPLTGSAPVPNPDLPDDVKADYLEARSIAALSPRGAALLRLAVDKLTTELGAAGRTVDDRIGDLVGKGLGPLVQQMLDSVRVIGNEAVHPGQIDLRDDSGPTSALFWLVNEIANEMITKRKRIQAIYGRLPENKLKAIEQRDKKVTNAVQSA